MGSTRVAMRERHYTGFWRLGAIIQIHILFLGIMALSGCNDSNNTSPPPEETPDAATEGNDLTMYQLVAEIGERFRGASGDVQQALGPQGEVIQERTKEEVEKLFRWEYRVVETEGTISAEEFEERLSELGEQGWECFDITTSAQVTRVTCKRRPRSAINYLKLIPGL